MILTHHRLTLKTMLRQGSIAARGGGHGLDAEIAAKANEKYDPELEQAVQKWIEGVLQVNGKGTI